MVANSITSSILIVCELQLEKVTFGDHISTVKKKDKL